MRVLHLFSNWRWTGPAEPAVTLCAALRQRGLHVQFTCGQEPAGRDNAVRRRATELGMDVLHGLALRKHFAPLSNRRDARRLVALLKDAPPQIIHCHLLGDHTVAIRAAEHILPRPKVVRTMYVADRIEDTFRTRRLLSQGTDAVIVPCSTAVATVTRVFELPRERIALIEAGVDTERFDPGRTLPDARAALGIRPDESLVGIIARIQEHRRYPIFVAAVAEAARSLPNLRVLVLGRGPDRDRLVAQPARRLGVIDRFIFSDYLWDDDFVSAVAALDLCVFLVPGTDGTCRAVREAITMGKPVVATKQGILPELIEHGRTGILVDGTAEALSSAIVDLFSHPDRLREMGSAAFVEARRRFPLRLQAERVHNLYEALLSGRSPAEVQP